MKLWQTGLSIGVFCVAFNTAAVADGMPDIPSDYPSHRQIGECNMNRVRQQLSAYNEDRLALSIIIRHLAEDQGINAEARERLLGFASSLDTMRSHLPDPNPDSDEFRNFDFRLGMTLTSMLIFINTSDPILTTRFTEARDNPASELGVYLTKLDASRTTYLDGLAAANKADCKT